MADTENQVPASASAEGEQPRPENEAPEPKREEAGAETEAEKKPRPEYEIIPSKREEPQSSFVTEHLHPVDPAQGVDSKNRPGQSQGQQARLSEASIERIQKFASSQTRVYAATGVGLGLLVGLVVAAIFLHPATPSGTTDMGNVTSDEYGLKGHLTTDWKNRLAFHLTVEPSAPEQRAGFLADVNSSPRPLSIGIQVKDPFGAVLCGDTILVKFDPRNVPVETANESKPRNEKAAKELAARNEIAQGLNLARQEAAGVGPGARQGCFS